MSKIKEVRIGVVGVGGMGGSHARAILQGNVPNARLAAICDINPAVLDRFDNSMLKFADSREMIRSGEVDAVVVATPHYAHTTIGIDTFNNGLHLLLEKPISVHKADCERLFAAYDKIEGKKPLFSVMFNLRTTPIYQKLRALVQDGHLGKITRVNWIITAWFRTQHYYDNGDWRATWSGEGGGVLLNQCPHNLDLLQWITGMPVRVRAFCSFGKYHDIEVEDDVTAYFEYDNGATGVFIATTGEAPGTDRLEITGECGKAVLEHGKLTFIRNESSMLEYSKTSKSGFARPEVWNVEIPVSHSGGQHTEILSNFANAIVNGTPLIADGRDGIRSVELANAMILSTLQGKTIELPLNSATYERALKKLIRESKYTKKGVTAAAPVDLSSTFNVPKAK
jgi:predicted dehydrogenase